MRDLQDESRFAIVDFIFVLMYHVILFVGRVRFKIRKISTTGPRVHEFSIYCVVLVEIGDHIAVSDRDIIIYTNDEQDIKTFKKLRIFWDFFLSRQLII